MIFPLLQVLLTAILVTYAGFWRRQQMKRRGKTWSEIVSQLRDNDWGIDEIVDRFPFKAGVRATPGDIWERITGCRGLWAMYKNAPVLVELADYAAEHGDNVNQELLEGLRSDAFQIRLCVMLALAQHMLPSSAVGAGVNAHRAAVTYSEMLAHLTEFIQQHSAVHFPSYLDAVA